MRQYGVVLVSGVVLGCGAARVDGEQQHPTVTFPTKLEAPPVAAEPTASTSAAAPQVPDPPAVRAKDQFQVTLEYERGEIRVVGVKELRFTEPQEGSRRTGRFALELWSVESLVARLRFDFPLLAAEGAPQGSLRPLRREPLFAPGAEVQATLQVPALEGVSHAQVVDRASGAVTAIGWPPKVETALVPSAAGGTPQPRDPTSTGGSGAGSGGPTNPQ